jgi:hypothetical protein
MAEYRLYILTVDGSIRRAADLEAGDDLEAIELVRLRGELADVELWSGTRKVGLIPQDGRPILTVTSMSDRS